MLFDDNDLNKESFDGEMTPKKVKIFEKLRDVFPTIKKGESVHYVSKSEWSMHDLVLYIIDIIGPAELYAVTWSVSNEAVGEILKYLKNGKITKMDFLVDWRVKVRRPEAYEFLKYNATKLYVSNTHAKVAVLRNENYHISIVSSANFTNNPRIESGVLTESKKIADFHIGWISEEIAGAKPFEEGES